MQCHTNKVQLVLQVHWLYATISHCISDLCLGTFIDLSRLMNMTTISRFAVVSVISLSFLANICIAVTQPYIIYPARTITQPESEDLSKTISAISEKCYNYTRWEKTIPEFWVAWVTTEAYTFIRSDLRVNRMPFLARTLLIGGIR